jgi:HlyD family secretion protein
MKKTIITVLVIAAVAASAGAYYYTRPGPEPKVATAAVTRGDITEMVSAMGSLDAVTDVTVGSQVGGIIQSLGADFNSIVKKDQVLLRINPDNINTQIEQAKATLAQKQADVEHDKVGVEDAQLKLKRTRELMAKQLVTQQDLDTADVNMQTAVATLDSSKAALVQAQANLDQQEVNLAHTIITSPIDGIVIQRAVDIGQTVQANFQSPTLFIIADDLTKMKCTANIDESDVGKIRPGQLVRVRVDAYPQETFFGTVVQVRLQAIVVQNVVTYGTVVDVPNPELKLKPGMTANVQVEIAKRTDVIRVPVNAVRFRPTAEIFDALNQPMPPELQQRGAGNRGQDQASSAAGSPGPRAKTDTKSGAPGSAATADARNGGPAPAAKPAGGDQRGGGDVAGAGGRRGFDPNDPEVRKRMADRLQAMAPEQKAQFIAQMKERGIDLTALVLPTPASASPLAAKGAQTIDALFGPLPPRRSAGAVWVWLAGQKQMKRVRLHLGVSDGQYFELLDGDVNAGQELVTGVTLADASKATTQTGNPLLQRPGMGGRGGYRGR